MNSEKVLVGLLLTLLAVTVSWKLLHTEPPREETLRAEPVPAAKRLQLVYVGAKWCAPCRQMKAHTFADPAVAAAIARDFSFLPLDVDVDKEAAKKFGVTKVPTTIVLDADGRELRRMVGYRPPAAFLDWLRAREAAPAKPAPSMELAQINTVLP
jgi:thiol:disulfide interchange protein